MNIYEISILWIIFLLPVLFTITSIHNSWDGPKIDSIPLIINNLPYPPPIPHDFYKLDDGSYRLSHNELYMFEPGMKVYVKDYWNNIIGICIIKYINNNTKTCHHGELTFTNGLNTHYSNIYSFFIETKTQKILDDLLSIFNDTTPNKTVNNNRPIPAEPDRPRRIYLSGEIRSALPDPRY